MVFNYKRSKIFIITKEGSPYFIVGGTTQKTVKDRLKALKLGYYKNFSVLQDFLDGAKITRIEKYPCNNMDELNKRVKYHILQYKVKELSTQEVYKPLIKVYDDKINTMYRSCNVQNKEDSFVLDLFN